MYDEMIVMDHITNWSIRRGCGDRVPRVIQCTANTAFHVVGVLGLLMAVWGPLSLLHWTQMGPVLFPSNSSLPHNASAAAGNAAGSTSVSSNVTSINAGSSVPWANLPVPLLDVFVSMQVIWLVAASYHRVYMQVLFAHPRVFKLIWRIMYVLQ